MTETETGTSSLVFESILEFIRTLAWCKQGETVLVAVQPCTPELIVAMSDREAHIFPGGTQIKINKSWLKTLQEKNAEGTPVPLLLAWKIDCLEIWYRRNKCNEYPYDVWQNPAADTEKECVKITGKSFGEKYLHFFEEALGRAKACPSMIPKM